jgi:hypothetical protein
MTAEPLDQGVAAILDDARAELRAAARQTPPKARERDRSRASPPPGSPPPPPPPGGTNGAGEPGATFQTLDPNLVAILQLAFTTTGRVVFNGTLRLEPEFADAQGAALAKAWAPVLAQVSTSPLAVAVATTATVCLPYAAQLAIRYAREPAATNVPQEPAPTGRKVGEQ